MTELRADLAELETFFGCLFRYADDGTFLSLRIFDQVDRSIPPLQTEGVPLNGDARPVLTRAVAVATRAANTSSPSVFCPPVATFADALHARARDVVNGLAVSVELDVGAIEEGRTRLEGLLGPATVVLASGGEFFDHSTGEYVPKLHLHWRLSEPTRTEEEHDQLREVRYLAADLAGGDPTAAPPAHPLRWPGSWHTKDPDKPRLARIIACNPDAEIDLGEAGEKLLEAIEALGMEEAGEELGPGRPRRRPGKASLRHEPGEPQAPLETIRAALEHIPNPDLDYDLWVRQGYAIFAATGGSAGGFDLFHRWSSRSAKHQDDETVTLWARIGKAAPRKIGAGTIFWQASINGWRRPPGGPEAPDAPEETDQAEGRSPRDQDPPLPPEDDRGPPPGPPPEEEEPPPLPVILRRRVRLADWDRRIIPARRWIVPAWIPAGQVTGIYGAAGTNKTDLLLQLLMARSAGLPFLGHKLEPGPAYGVFCEDETEELVRRAARIAEGYRVSLAEFTDCHFVSLVGVLGTEFVTFDGAEMVIGPELRRFDQEIVRLGAGLAVLDTIADFFGGNESNRREVSQFVRALDLVSLGRRCAIVATAHPSVRGQNSGSLDSGSTGWRGKMRSRLTIHDPGTDEDPEEVVDRKRRHQPREQTDRRILVREKSNYAKQGERLELVIRDSFFAPGALDPDQAKRRGPARDQAAKERCLELLRKVEAQGGYVNDATRGDHYAPKVFARRPDGREFSAAEYSRAMQRLFVAGRLRLVKVGPPSKSVEHLVEVAG